MAQKKVRSKKNTSRKAVPNRLRYDTSRLGSSTLTSEPLRPIQIHSLPAKQTLNVLGLGYALGAVRFALVLVISVLGLFGYASEAVSLLESVHFTFSLTPLGIIAGLLETTLWGFLMGLLFGWVYNRFI
ncbi:hypothetical protein HYT55_03580 [Candidatus Woesearchaeota archaeon]|nr:hypothetical protein [Candidatus Woesearchaeota archaeon]